LRIIDPVLAEGIHYSIMFTGGALVNSLSANDPDVEEFISLRRLNRNIAIVIDSDKKSAHAQINQTKKRLRKEFNAGDNGLAWITAGYTIENYLPPELLREAVLSVHPSSDYQWDGDRYSNPLAKDATPGMTSAANKARIAVEVASMWNSSTDWPYDLREKMSALSKFVRVANDLPF